MTTEILIAQSHPLFADALQLNICSVVKSARFTHAKSLCAARNAIHQNEFDLILLDLPLPDTHGFDGLLELRRASACSPIVIFSALTDPPVVTTASICGAAGFIPKTAPKEIVLQGIRDVLGGRPAFPDHSLLPQRLVKMTPLPTLIATLNSLTDREFRVLQLLGQGLDNKRIARELRLAESTAKFYTTGVLRKLRVSSRTQAVAELTKLYLHPVRALYARNRAEDKSIMRAKARANFFPAYDASGRCGVDGCGASLVPKRRADIESI
jgi:DNA-binding NarL/FixJ family response regulator